MTRRLAVLLGMTLAAIATATPSGKRWFTLPVHYKVYAHSAINGVSDFQGVALPKIRSGFARWVTPTVACTKWNTVYDGTFTSPTGRAALDPNPGSGNLLIWLGGPGAPAGWEWTHDSATLALTTVTAYFQTGEIIDADIEFNNDQAWKVGGGTTNVDVESIATHEGGHFLGLAHSPSSSSVMFANYAFGELKTTLSSEDLQDVCGEYPSDPDAGVIGTPCSSDTQCKSPYPSCRGPLDGGQKLCTLECSGGLCPSGYQCEKAVPDGGALACLRRTGSTDLCEFCASGQECSTGICVTDSSRRHNFCTIACRTDAECGAGYVCDGAATGGGLCVPSASCGGQCSGPLDCAAGYDCVGGLCEANGTQGARCEVTAYCQAPCFTCVGSSDEAYCRTCCGGYGSTGVCASCTNTSTACSGQACVGLSTGFDSVCVPNSGAASCQPCGAGTPCQDGMSCVFGRCHYGVVPAHPGACEAIFQTGTNQYFCACQDEIAAAGSACGPTVNGGYVACVNGNVCLGTPSTCHPTCSQLGAACATGGTCQYLYGQFVCGTEGQSGGRCEACDAGSCGGGLTCYAGRCYQACDISAPACAPCIQVGFTFSASVCGCPDQVVGTGQACGVVDGGVAGCSNGAECDDGTCRTLCNPTGAPCPSGQQCQSHNGKFLCLPAGAVDGGGQPDSGIGGGGATSGCGCGVSGVFPLGLIALGWALGRRRRS